MWAKEALAYPSVAGFQGYERHEDGCCGNDIALGMRMGRIIPDRIRRVEQAQ